MPNNLVSLLIKLIKSSVLVELVAEHIHCGTPPPTLPSQYLYSEKCPQVFCLEGKDLASRLWKLTEEGRFVSVFPCIYLFHHFLIFLFFLLFCISLTTSFFKNENPLHRTSLGPVVGKHKTLEPWKQGQALG